MLRKPITLRVLSGLVVLVMGVLGLVMALATGEIYHRLTLDNQREGLAGLVDLAASEALDRLKTTSGELGLSIQSDPVFERTLRSGDARALSELLDAQFHRYFVTAGQIRLLRLRVFSPRFELLAEAGETGRGARAGSAACPQLMLDAAGRRGPERMKLLAALCADPLPLHSVIVPMGGLTLRGYLEVVVDPSHNLTGLERALGMPLRIQAIDGSELYRAASWPAGDRMDKALAVYHELKANNGQPVLGLTMLSDVSALQGQLAETRRRVLIVATVLTAVVALLLHQVLRTTMLAPITGLLERLQHYGQNGGAAGRAAVPASAIRELHALQDVYDTLDHLASTDPLTQLPNRAQFRDVLARCAGADRAQCGGFALLMLDLNGFKQVNDRFGHQAGDALLGEVALRLASTKRRDDILARLGGDEFGMILAGVTDREIAGAVAEKLIRVLAEPFEVGTATCHVGASIGIALHGRDADRPDELTRLADAAMYEAKRARAGYAFARPEAAPAAG